MKDLTYQTPLPHTAVSPQRTLFTVEEFVQLPEFGYLTKSSLRHLIFNSHPRCSASGEVIAGNGLVEAGAIIRMGRRILISAPEFRVWALSQREVVALP